MINVLIPCMGKSTFYKDYFFPKALYEVGGKTMLEKTVSNFESLSGKKMIFVFGDSDCKQFHLDDSAKILAGPDSQAIVLDGETMGALCTCMMSVDNIDNNQPLIIANYDQIIDVDFGSVVHHFESRHADAGVIVFNDIHPRWCYARLGAQDTVVEVAEKRPLSHHAIAGFYYFRHGSDFVKAASHAILKGRSFGGVFYISASLNELILSGKKIVCYPIEKQQYHSFYSPEKVAEYLRGE